MGYTVERKFIMELDKETNTFKEVPINIYKVGHKLFHSSEDCELYIKLKEEELKNLDDDISEIPQTNLNIFTKGRDIIIDIFEASHHSDWFFISNEKDLIKIRNWYFKKYKKYKKRIDIEFKGNDWLRITYDDSDDYPQLYTDWLKDLSSEVETYHNFIEHLIDRAYYLIDFIKEEK